MPGISLSRSASASAYSWLGPPRPLPRTVTVSSPPDRIATRLPSLRACSARRACSAATSRASPSRSAPSVDHRIAGLASDLDRGVERGLGLRDQLELRAGKGRVARLAAFVPGVVERAADRIVDAEIVFRDDGARIGERGRIRHGRSRCDRGWIVMRNVRDRQRDDLGASAGARQPAALDPRQMLADDVDLADRRARAQERAVHLLLLRERHAFGRRDPVRRAAAGHQHQQQIVRGRFGRQPQRVVGAPSVRPHRARDGRLRPP